MAARTIINTIKTIFGGNFAQLVKEHNKLVDEVEELKTQFAAHTHAGVTAGAGTSSATAGTFTTYAKPDAQKIG